MRLTVSSTLPIPQDIAYLISCSKDGGKIKNVDHYGPRTIPKFATFQTRLLSRWSIPLKCIVFSALYILKIYRCQ
jgi:hypothetical protein